MVHWRPPRRLRGALVGLAIASSAFVPHAALADASPSPTPEGFTAAASDALASGVTHTRFVRKGNALVVDVARVPAGGPATLRTVLSNNDIDGGLERTSGMCQRVNCVVGINGDFHHLETGQPVGGLVAGGEMLRSPVPSHHQLMFTPSGAVAAGQLKWSGRLMASDLRDVQLTDVNRDRAENAVVLYTPAWGHSTSSNAYGAEMTLQVTEPAGPVRLGQTSLVNITGFVDGVGNAAIPYDGLVVSAHGTGAAALRDLWARVQSGAASSHALLRLEAATDASESLGGTPVLVHDGKPFVGNDGSAFMAGQQPRTIVGWTAAGDVLLVTIDGRQPGYSEGISLPDAARLMVGLGAAEALNLDGGGSTTFVANGTVVNQPSDRLVRHGGTERIVHTPGPGDIVVGPVERPVSVALVVVAGPSAKPAPVDPLARGAALPKRADYRELALGVPPKDPGSDPTGGLPALVSAGPSDSSSSRTRSGSATIAGALLFAVFVPTVRATRRTLRPSRARWRT